MSWPFEKLGPGECIIAHDYHNKVSVGEQVTVTISWTNYWNNMRHQYNEAAEKMGWLKY